MDHDRWRRVSALFSTVLDEADGRVLLDTSIDPVVRREVESLLIAHEAVGPFDRLASQMQGGLSRRWIDPGVSEDPSPRLEPGARVGRHEIRECLGVGGMGEVYRAFDTRLQREVALKVVRRPATPGATGILQLEQEARAASALNHPNIVTVYDIGEEAAFPYLVMELIEGHSLRSMIAAPWPIELLLHLAVQIADGLVAAHERRILHGDLKPENILVSRQGVAKIVDFGLARFRACGRRRDRAEDDAAGVAGPDSPLGTLGYLAPERLSAQPVDDRADQFALGSILYEMATGTPALVGAAPLETLAQTLIGEPRPLAEARRDLPAAFARAVTRCLRKSPSERYASTRELLDELRAARRESAPPSAPSLPPRRASGCGRSATRGRTSFVGRNAELRQFLALWRSTAHGRGESMVIRGPAGIGKTRLAEECAARARRRGARVAFGRGGHDGDQAPLWPWRTILRELGAPEGIVEERAGDVTPGRFSRFLAVLDHLRAVARTAPLVVVLDDLHRADSASLLLARFLGREGRGLPLLLVFTHRDDVVPARAEAAALVADVLHGATSITLEGLSDEAVAAYVTAAGLPAPDPELLRALAGVTRGNPLHLRSVVTQSRLAATGMTGGLEPAVQRALEALSAADQRSVGVAALLGTDVFVHEVARVADVAPTSAAEALARAAEAGLVVARDDGRFAFVHEVLRQAALASRPASERLEAHARAALVLTGAAPDRQARRAHHALAAASRSREDARTAVVIARQVAAALRAADGFESTAALLARCVDVHETAALSGPLAELLVEWAEAVLACGRLAEARELFQRAACVAEAEGQAAALARAALGLGGVWVSEHRLSYEAERVAVLQRRALDALPAEATVLRARLRMRLAAEEAYRRGPLAPVLDGVAAARAFGDPLALAEALSLGHHALLSPEHTWERPALVDELIAAATAANDGLLVLIGLCWRTADYFLLGEPRAVVALAELRLRADALHCQSVLFIVHAMEVMLAVRDGRFEAAEAAAQACYELGRQVGDADALAYYGAHLIAIRSFQGREAELADLAASIAGSPTLMDTRERAFASAAALFALRAGRPEAAQRLLRQWAEDGLASIPSSSTSLATLLVVAEIAAALQNAPVARAVYEALRPYADLPVMASLAVVCFGSVHRPLGIAALAFGEPELAVDHFTAAVAANERLGNRPAAIQAQAERALAEMRRGSVDDVRRGRLRLDQAMAAAEAAGMGGLVTRWHESARS
jgi:hypothetical protein